MIVGCISSESRTSPGSPYETPIAQAVGVSPIYERVASAAGSEEKKVEDALDKLSELLHNLSSALIKQRSSLKIRIQRTDKCEHRGGLR